MRKDSRDPDTAESIVDDLLAYLRENPDVCAAGNVNGWRWVRYHDGEWQATRYGGQHRLSRYVDGTVLEADEARRWLTTNPVELIPAADAIQWGPSETSVWEDAADQDVFTDAERCFWCGQSERSVALEGYETTDHGECDLCSECHDSWEKAGELAESGSGGVA